MMSRTIAATAFLAFLAGMPNAAKSYQLSEGLTPSGLSGGLVVPTAGTLPGGTVGIGYSNLQLLDDNTFVGGSLERYAFTTGFYDFLEVGGLVSLSNVQTDLSFNAKLKVPFIPENLPQFALAFADVGGAHSFFTSHSAVASYQLGRVGLTYGYGIDSKKFRQSYGGVSLALWRGLAANVDYADGTIYEGLRWVTPPILNGLRLQAGVIAAQGHGDSNIGGSFALLVDLDRPRNSANATKPSPPAPDPNHDRRAEASAPVTVAPPATFAVTTETLPPKSEVARQDTHPSAPSAVVGPEQWVMALAAAGFRGSQVREGEAGYWQVAVENSRYRNNELDGLGVAIGTIAAYSDCSVKEVKLAFRRDGLSLGLFRFKPAAIRREWGLEERCAPTAVEAHTVMHVQLYTDLPRRPDEARLSSARSIDLSIYPRLRFALAGETAAFAYSLSWAAEAKIPLWRGATLDVVELMPIHETVDYRRNGPYDSFGLRNGLNGLQLQQAFNLGYDTVLTAGGGLYDHDYKGGLIETRTVIDPNNTLYLRGGVFDDSIYDKTREMGSINYVLSSAPLQAGANVGYNYYLFGDSGPSLELFRDFRDVRLSLFVQQTGQTYAGFRVSLPLSPPKALALGPVVVRGNEAWSTQVRTEVNSDVANFFRPNSAFYPYFNATLARQYANNDRWSVDYIVAHMDRMADAYKRWGASPAETNTAPP